MTAKTAPEKDSGEKQRFILYGVTAVVIILLIVFFIKIAGLGTTSTSPPDLPEEPKEIIEITEVDMFPLDGKTGEDISVLGVKLGDTKKDVQEKIGLPDLQITYPISTNWEYRESLTLDKIGLLIHFDYDEVTRITIKAPFNKFLHGETIIKHTKNDIYRMFGKPDELKLLSYFTQHTYYTKGFEVFQSRKIMTGFSLIPVQLEKARDSVIDKSLILVE